MDRLNGVVLLACVCVMLIVVSGAAESEKVSGFNYGAFPINLLGVTGAKTNSTTGANGNTTTGGQGNSTKNGASAKGSSLSNWPSLPFLSSLLALPVWLLVVAAIVSFGGACLFVLRLGTSVRVLDLESTLQEMEQQLKYLEETWSYKLRNAALLRYYLLMRRACVKVGLRDEPAETPQEYVGRVSSFFKVERPEADKFASAVNRSRYGEELSEPEAGEASRFMGAFTDVIRRRAGEGQ